jgi:hypothetical protein
MTTLASPEPASATVRVSGTQFTGVNFHHLSTLNGSSDWNRVPFWPVNSLDIDRIYRASTRSTRNATRVPLHRR